ncbi:type I restriction enzyme HsdR N-terminal domain-containing protein [Nannocystis pusilla]|uniref:type I restriction enzyme HsdR N-terminal domain-containing protein n=1 Tax=Nannocystis pusilla TaxID=889268 RepID=UPI003DA21C92
MERAIAAAEQWSDCGERDKGENARARYGLLTPGSSSTYTGKIGEIMGAYHDQLQRLAEQIRKRLPHVHGEESTKQALILPFIAALGYDIYDPTEIRPEYVADFAKKRPGGPAEKVDYAIHLGGTPVIFVECKAADVALHNFSGQLARYFNATPACPVAVLTNGVKYMFFTDLEERNILSEKAFFEFDILNFTEAEVEVLESFSRERFNPSGVREQAEEIIYTSKISGYIGSILRSPPENFTRFVLGELSVFAGKRLTPRVIEKFTPTIKRAIQATLLDMATRSIKDQAEQKTEPPVVAPPPKVDVVATLPPPPVIKVEDKSQAPAAPTAPTAPTGPAAPTAPAAPNIVTTAEELEALDIIRAICADSPVSPSSPILHKDTSSWFTISTISIRRWFVRLYFNQRKKSIFTKVSPEQAKALSPGFEVDKGFVYINSVKDLYRLRPLLLLAYEEAARQTEPAEAEAG